MAAPTVRHVHFQLVLSQHLRPVPGLIFNNLHKWIVVVTSRGYECGVYPGHIHVRRSHGAWL